MQQIPPPPCGKQSGLPRCPAAARDGDRGEAAAARGARAEPAAAPGTDPSPQGSPHRGRHRELPPPATPGVGQRQPRGRRVLKKQPKAQNHATRRRAPVPLWPPRGRAGARGRCSPPALLPAPPGPARPGRPSPHGPALRAPPAAPAPGRGAQRRLRLRLRLQRRLRGSSRPPGDAWRRGGGGGAGTGGAEGAGRDKAPAPFSSPLASPLLPGGGGGCAGPCSVWKVLGFCFFFFNRNIAGLRPRGL